MVQKDDRQVFFTLAGRGSAVSGRPIWYLMDRVNVANASDRAVPPIILHAAGARMSIRLAPVGNASEISQSLHNDRSPNFVLKEHYNFKASVGL